jgi:hypothetical protein
MQRRRPIVVISITLALIITSAIVARTDAKSQGNTAPGDTVVAFGEPHPQSSLSQFAHILVPDDVTIQKGGTVTFVVNGGGHGIAIYPVSKDTTREDITRQLCQHDDVV